MREGESKRKRDGMKLSRGEGGSPGTPGGGVGLDININQNY